MDAFIFIAGCTASFLLGFLFAALFNVSSGEDDDAEL